MLSEVDDEGNVTRATTKCDIYGAAVTQEGATDSKHHFVGSIGHTTEPSTGGLIYMRARWYDPATGRFVSEDRARDGVNWYAYCGNSPVTSLRWLPLIPGAFGVADPGGSLSGRIANPARSSYLILHAIRKTASGL